MLRSIPKTTTQSSAPPNLQQPPTPRQEIHLIRFLTKQEHESREEKDILEASLQTTGPPAWHDNGPDNGGWEFSPYLIRFSDYNGSSKMSSLPSPLSPDLQIWAAVQFPKYNSSPASKLEITQW